MSKYSTHILDQILTSFDQISQIKALNTMLYLFILGTGFGAEMGGKMVHSLISLSYMKHIPCIGVYDHGSGID